MKVPKIPILIFKTNSKPLIFPVINNKKIRLELFFRPFHQKEQQEFMIQSNHHK